MHPSEPDPIFLAPRRPRKGPGKLTRKDDQGEDRPSGGMSELCTRPNTSIRNQLVPRSASWYRLNNSASVPGGSAGCNRAGERV